MKRAILSEFRAAHNQDILGLSVTFRVARYHSSEILGLALISAPLFGDAFITLLRRFFSSQNVFKAHRQHIYQRLYLGGASKRFVCLLYILQSSVIAYTYIRLNFVYEIVTVFICFFIMFIVDIKYALSFKNSLKNPIT